VDHRSDPHIRRRLVDPAWLVQSVLFDDAGAAVPGGRETAEPGEASVAMARSPAALATWSARSGRRPVNQRGWPGNRVARVRHAKEAWPGPRPGHGGASAAVSGRDDRGSVNHCWPTSRYRGPGRCPVVGAPDGRARDRRLAVVRSRRFVRVDETAGASWCSRANSSSGAGDLGRNLHSRPCAWWRCSYVERATGIEPA
jgi:hypothetical protein